MYKKHLLSAFGRCIEHSGMPVFIGKNAHLFPPRIMDANQLSLVAFDKRVNKQHEDDCKLSSKMLKFNGFATQEFQQKQVDSNFFIVNHSEALITEKMDS